MTGGMELRAPARGAGGARRMQPGTQTSDRFGKKTGAADAGCASRPPEAGSGPRGRQQNDPGRKTSPGEVVKTSGGPRCEKLRRRGRRTSDAPAPIRARARDWLGRGCWCIAGTPWPRESETFPASTRLTTTTTTAWGSPRNSPPPPPQDLPPFHPGRTRLTTSTTSRVPDIRCLDFFNARPPKS